MFLSGLMLGASFLAGVALASPLTSSSALPYAESEVVWTGPWALDGSNVTLKGTVQEIYPQLQQINPGLFPDINSTAEGVEHKITKRVPLDLHCGWPPDKQDGSPEAAGDNIKYLNRVLNSNPGAIWGNDATSCGRIACEYNTGVFWCNDNHFYKTASASDIVNRAGVIYSWCFNGDSEWFAHWGRGQYFDNDETYNVLIYQQQGLC